MTTTIEEFENLINLNVIGKNTIIKCKYNENLYGDISGIVTDYFIIDEIKIDNKEIFFFCSKKETLKKYIFTVENILEVDGMNIDRLKKLFLKRKKGKLNEW